MLWGPILFGPTGFGAGERVDKGSIELTWHRADAALLLRPAIASRGPPSACPTPARWGCKGPGTAAGSAGPGRTPRSGDSLCAPVPCGGPCSAPRTPQWQTPSGVKGKFTLPPTQARGGGQEQPAAIPSPGQQTGRQPPAARGPPQPAGPASRLQKAALRQTANLVVGLCMDGASPSLSILQAGPLLTAPWYLLRARQCGHQQASDLSAALFSLFAAHLSAPGVTAVGAPGQLGCVSPLPLGSHRTLLWLRSSRSTEHLLPRGRGSPAAPPFAGGPQSLGSCRAVSQVMGLPGDPLASAGTPRGEKTNPSHPSVEAIVSGVQSTLVPVRGNSDIVSETAGTCISSIRGRKRGGSLHIRSVCVPLPASARSPSITPVTAPNTFICLCQSGPVIPACCERPWGPAVLQEVPLGPLPPSPPGAVGATRGCRALMPGLTVTQGRDRAARQLWERAELSDNGPCSPQGRG